MRLAYLDASALTKLIVQEAETRALFRWYVETERTVTSRVGIIETVRAAGRRPFDATVRDRVIEEVAVVELDPAIATTAGVIGPSGLRSLDAIHIATALALLPELDAFVTYDDRQAEAARLLGLPVIRPA